MNEILLLVVIFLSNAIQAITGFAGTLLAMPAAILLVGMDDAKVILAVMAFLSCLMICAQNFRSINWKEVLKITVFMLVGMGIGMKIYEIAAPDMLLTIYGVIVILVGVKSFVVKKELKLNKWALLAILLLAGIIHGMFVSGGALLVIYATFVMKDKDEFRATVASIWVILDAILMVTYAAEGMVTTFNTKMILWSIVPLVVATYLGNRFQKKIKQETFLKLTYILLILSGVSLL